VPGQKISRSPDPDAAASICEMASNGFTGPAGYSHAGADGAVRDFGQEHGGTYRASPQRAAREDQQSARPKGQPVRLPPLQIQVSPLLTRGCQTKLRRELCRNLFRLPSGNPRQKLGLRYLCDLLFKSSSWFSFSHLRFSSRPSVKNSPSVRLDASLTTP